MSDEQDQGETKGRLSLRPANRTELGRTVDAGSVRQSFSHGRSKVVQVEVRKKRGGAPGASAESTATRPAPAPVRGGNTVTPVPRSLTATEQAARQRAVADQQRESARRDAERREQETISILSAAEEARRREEEAAKLAEEENRKRIEEESRRREEEAARPPAAPVAEPVDPVEAPAARDAAAVTPTPAAPPAPVPRRVDAPPPPRRPATSTPAAAVTPETLRLKAGRAGGREDEDEAPRVARRPGGGGGALPARKPVAPPAKKVVDDRRRGGARIDVQAAISGEDERVRSLASVRRQRDRERRQAELEMLRSDQVRVVRDVILPETITVQELANRMAARVPDVVKSLMKLGVMATATQSIDADTAEIVVEEFGHKSKRVSEGDVEIGLEGVVDADADLRPRPPVVTIMGHVDHGKTSLLDALRSTSVAAGEAGGITQHIGAYQVTLPSGERMTFIDTPGHEAFTAMRARGAQVTDIVVLVVAADDGVMPQTIEAIRHAKAANVPIIVAINKIDRPDANPTRVRSELLQYDIAVEEMGGETQDVEVSALKREGLDRLQEAILLQAEILDLKANPDRSAEGAVIESRLDRGRGPVATILVQKGTLKQGDIVVAGTEQGRVRAMLDEHGKPVTSAGPSVPVEILGMSGVPSAGEAFVVVEDEGRAREIAEFRQRRQRETNAVAGAAARGTLDQMLARIQAGEQKEVALLIKADVQGSAEAIQALVTKLGNDEVRVRVLLAAVGQITESDVQLAKASDAIVVGFNVRANAQARALSNRDGVDIRYFSIIYQVADDIEKLVKGKLAPVHREKFLGYAEIRQVFNITKTGKVAGCYVTEGLVKRGAGVRLLREGVVVHQGELSQLKRFKDDVREVARGYECGLSFAGFGDIREGDVVECYETELVPA
ncbi:translation initiation factor IF-2 [Acidiphilium sp. PA]|uniref:translation initiation factor IF-2 n=1 Tax=Acidiphilium sp. PA TaxID=2871705 RepID=UPI00224474D4|nr:translation initiation factor IF-2 [Acidiphilium sp. PA]MCW8305624.1 translation initiation factor IF-2 [Acidiphilium sp. PA]